MKKCEVSNCEDNVRSQRGKSNARIYCHKHYRQVLKHGRLTPESEREVGFDNKLNPLYNTWVGMKQRCTDTNSTTYKYYGGRGIRVCDSWLKSFQAFAYDMGIKPTPEHTIERMNNDGDYEPTNCKWATTREQGLNKRVREGNNTGISNLVKTKSGTFYTRRYNAVKGTREYIGTFKTKKDALVAFNTVGRPFVTGTKGSNNPMAKLNESDVKQVRDKISAGSSQAQIARDFKVSPASISNIKHNKVWVNEDGFSDTGTADVDEFDDEEDEEY